MLSTPHLPSPVAPGRIVLIEDDAMLRGAIAANLRVKFSPRVVGEFATGREGLGDCLREAPALLIADLRLPDCDGREIIRQVLAKHPAVRVVVLTAFTSERLPAELITLGVGGLVDKDSPIEQIESAVQRVLAGGMYFTAGVGPAASSWAPATASPGQEKLSEQERAVVRLVVAGLSSKQAAAQLEFSPRTVEKYRARAMQKIGLRNHTELVRWALQHGLG